MHFRTVVDILPSEVMIYHHQSLLMMGSCFAQSIGEKLVEAKFCTTVNPFGELYNPSSIEKALDRMLSGRMYDECDLFEYQGRWHSFEHHSSFSFETKEKTLKNMNEQLSVAAESVKNTDFLLLTFGTSWVYRLQESGEVVSNCHKLPAKKFIRSRLTVEEIVRDYKKLITTLRKINPTLKVILTVSPIRHWKDGANENNLSKAVLLLSVEALCKELEGVCYFPSYEIVLDELRDYRFFAEDMLHPSAQAIDYVWERFSENYFSAETKKILKQIEKIRQAASHRPFAPDTEEYKKFVFQQLQIIAKLEQTYPTLNFDVEKSKFQLYC